MTLKERLLTVSASFADAKKLSLSRVSTIVFGDGKVIDRLQRESDITTGRYEAAMLWFSSNWPEGVDWPADIARPVAAPAPEQAA